MSVYAYCALEKYNEETKQWEFVRNFAHFGCGTRDTLYGDLLGISNYDITLTFNDYLSAKDLSKEVQDLQKDKYNVNFISYLDYELNTLVDKLQKIRAKIEGKKNFTLEDKDTYQALYHIIGELSYLVLYCAYELEDYKCRFIFYEV